MFSIIEDNGIGVAESVVLKSFIDDTLLMFEEPADISKMLLKWINCDVSNKEIYTSILYSLLTRLIGTHELLMESIHNSYDRKPNGKSLVFYNRINPYGHLGTFNNDIVDYVKRCLSKWKHSLDEEHPHEGDAYKLEVLCEMNLVEDIVEDLENCYKDIIAEHTDSMFKIPDIGT